ncbi:hypothetical protein HDU76_002473 [Blyttiomyces sp. JEL0837]|nr:hypothetical protein HDU76_002473 [Blyttiomyces sp. JEL0837]
MTTTSTDSTTSSSSTTPLMAPDVYVRISQPAASPVINQAHAFIRKKSLCLDSIHEGDPDIDNHATDSLPSVEFFFVKDKFLQLMEYDLHQNRMNVLIKQNVFGTIYDTAVLRCNLFVPLENFDNDQSRTTAGTRNHQHLIDLTTTDPIDETEFDEEVETLQQHQSFSDDDESRMSGILLTSNQEMEALRDVLVCVSDSGKLSFVGVKEDMETGIPLRLESLFEIELNMPASTQKELGRQVFVDPLSRAIIVSTRYNVFRFFLIESVKRNPFRPVSLRNSVCVEEEGMIWDMAFLHPLSDSIHFAAVLVTNKVFTVVIYEVTHNGGSPHIRRSKSLRLPDGFVPVKIIGLNNVPKSLLLVGEESFVCVSHNESDGYMEPWRSFESKLPDEMEKNSLITALIQRTLDPFASQGRGIMYLVTDSGQLFLLSISESPWRVSWSFLGKRNAASFLAVVGTPKENCDLLLQVGDMCDSDLMEVNHAKGTVKYKHSVRNWAPVIDFDMADTSTSGCETMYMTSGQGPYGKVVRIRKSVKMELFSDILPGMEGVTDLWSFKIGGDEQTESLLAISFISETRLMRLTEGTLEDISDDCGLHLASPSIFVGALDVESFVVQVHKRGVIVTKPGRTNSGAALPPPAVWKPADPDSTIVMAGLSGNTLCLVVAPHNSIFLLKILADNESSTASIVDMCSNNLETDMSCLFCPDSIYGNICFIGTYKPSIVVVSLDSAQQLSILSEHQLKSFTHEEIMIPNSFRLMEYEGRQVLMSSFRDGKLVAYSIQNDFSLVEIDSVYLGRSPVRLVSGAGYRGYVLGLSDHPWKVHLDEGTLVAEPIGYDSSSVSIATPFIHGLSENEYIFIDNGCMKFVSVDAQINYNLKDTMGTKKTPRRILYDPFTKHLIVACNMQSEPGSPWTGELKLIDPKSGSQLLKETLPTGEVCYSLAFWNVKEGKRYICLGTWGYVDTSGPEVSTTLGRVLVYSLKLDTKLRPGSSPHKSPYKIRQLGEFILPDMVLCITAFLNSYLLAAAGNTLYQLKIDAQSRKLVSGARIDLRWPIRSLSAFGNCIYVGGLKESISLYTFMPQTKKFTFCMSDELPRVPGDCVSMDQSMTVSSDRHGNLFGLMNKFSLLPDRKTDPLEFRFATFFEFNVGEIILRLKIGSMDSDIQRDQDQKGGSAAAAASPLTKDAKHALVGGRINAGWDVVRDESNLEAEVFVKEASNNNRARKSVYGVGISGGVYVVQRIAKDVYEPLALLQQILSEVPATRPLLGKLPAIKTKLKSGAKRVIDDEVISTWKLLTKSELAEVQQLWTEGWGTQESLLFHTLLKSCEGGHR